MTTLIIGTGVVGSQIAAQEIARGETPVLLELAPQTDAIGKLADISQLKLVQGDVLNPMDIARVISDYGITRIIHTAANALLTEGALRNPYSAIQLNIMGTVNVLEAARIFGIERVVACSSSVTYARRGGEDEGALGREEAYPRPASIYATTKQAVEDLGLNYFEWYGLDFRAVRYAVVFGPWTGRGGGGGVTVRFRDLIERSLRGEEAQVFDLGSSVEPLYSKDAARATIAACHNDDLRSRVFNVGMGRVYTSQDIKNAIEEVIPSAKLTSSTDSSVASTVPHPTGPTPSMDIPMDSTRSREELGFEPQYDLVAAIRDFVTTIQS